MKEKKEKKYPVKAKLDFWLVLLSYLFISNIPFQWFTKDSKTLLICQLVAQGVFFVLSFIFVMTISKCKYKTKPFNFVSFLILLPLFIVCGSNFTYLLFSKGVISISFKFPEFIFSFFITLFTAVNEELIFRFLMLGNMKTKRGIYKVLLTSLFFGLLHFTRYISSGFNALELLSVVYTFGLGMCCAFLFEYAGAGWSAILFHFLFNFCNGILFESLVDVTKPILFYLVAIAFGAFVTFYLFVTYMVRFRKRA